MIKVYTVKSNAGLTLQVACTPFGLVLYPGDDDIRDVFTHGWSWVKKVATSQRFKWWKGSRYRVIGVKMIRGCNE